MSERLYLVNRAQMKYLCIGKDFGGGYMLGNVDLLNQFLKDSHWFEIVKIAKDGDDMLADMKNVNTENKWADENENFGLHVDES